MNKHNQYALSFEFFAFLERKEEQEKFFLCAVFCCMVKKWRKKCRSKKNRQRYCGLIPLLDAMNEKRRDGFSHHPSKPLVAYFPLPVKLLTIETLRISPFFLRFVMLLRWEMREWRIKNHRRVERKNKMSNVEGCMMGIGLKNNLLDIDKIYVFFIFNFLFCWF